MRVLAASSAVPRGLGTVTSLSTDNVGDRNIGGLDKLDDVAPLDIYGDDDRDGIVVRFWRLALGIHINFYRVGGALSRHKVLPTLAVGTLEFTSVRGAK